MQPSIGKNCKELCSQSNLKYIKTKDFSVRKEQMLRAQKALDDSPGISVSEQKKILSDVRDQPPSSGKGSGLGSRLYSVAVSAFSPPRTFGTDTAKSMVASMKDEDFLVMIPAMTEKHPILVEMAEELLTIARRHLSAYITTEVNKVVYKIEELRKSECKRQLKAQSDNTLKSSLDISRKAFFHATKDRFLRHKDR
jgi:hypothetical protein